ncbi:MAG: YfhO family protein [Lactobacillus sp.]|nr:YfhO family protein [Lactobacillus sp.]MDN6051995.1 YfhO family protein [Lactobacillus sp.]
MFKTQTNHQLITKITFILSFIIPLIIFSSYFLYHHSGILTVDLGQQYVDFLSFYQQNIFHQPLKFIYSFQNGLGNSMLGTSAYYLLSPFNLLLLLFPTSQLPAAIFWLIAIKVGAIGLNSYWYWQRKTSMPIALAASSAFALSGFVVANHFNLMWLDSVILLSCLIASLDRLLTDQPQHLVLITFLLWVTNFYTGYMVLVFGLCYFLSQNLLHGWRNARCWRYLKLSLIGSALASFILFPTLIELLQGKAAGSAHWQLIWQFPLAHLLGKLTIGSYNFHEMEAGLPNIFITSALLVAATAYFFNTQISKRTRLINGLLLAFLICSLSFTPLVLGWQMGQFPVWYPGRFSFIISFWLLELAVGQFSQLPQFNWRQLCGLLILVAGLISYWLIKRSQWPYLDQHELIITISFVVIGIIFITLIPRSPQLFRMLILLTVLLEAGTNLYFSLGHLSYQRDADYRNYTQNVKRASDYLQQHDASFFRVDKTFFRSDNDSFSDNFNSLANFNSITNQASLKFMAALGYLHNSNSYTNHGGTALTDALLGVKYYLQPNFSDEHLKQQDRMTYNNRNNRIDVNQQKLIHTQPQLLLYRATALPLIFLSQPQRSPHFESDQPIKNQQRFYQTIFGKQTSLFHRNRWPHAVLKHAKRVANQPQHYQRQASHQFASVSLTYQVRTSDTYYLELPRQLNSTNLTLMVNGVKLTNEVREEQTQLINICQQAKGQTLAIKLTFSSPSLDLTTIKLWRLNQRVLHQRLKHYQLAQPTICEVSPLQLSVTPFTLKRTKIVNSTIPWSANWLVFDHGHLLKTQRFLQTFVAAKLAPGKHQLTYYYLPRELLVGLLISLLTLLVWLKFKIVLSH